MNMGQIYLPLYQFSFRLTSLGDVGVEVGQPVDDRVAHLAHRLPGHRVVLEEGGQRPPGGVGQHEQVLRGAVLAEPFVRSVEAQQVVVLHEGVGVEAALVVVVLPVVGLVDLHGNLLAAQQPMPHLGLTED